jgi:5,10-methylenetetrahydromethanopterin reductase
MDFGMTVATAADAWKVVKRAEELGFTCAWFYDTQMLNADPFVAMAGRSTPTRSIWALGCSSPPIAWHQWRRTVWPP